MSVITIGMKINRVKSNHTFKIEMPYLSIIGTLYFVVYLF